MTPHEFAQRLEKAGLPAHPVQQLTRLFERVRYGAFNPGKKDVDEAVACLNAIAACFEAKS
jgi:2-iminoacetate synthase ThiH